MGEGKTEMKTRQRQERVKHGEGAGERCWRNRGRWEGKGSGNSWKGLKKQRGVDR